MNHLLIIAIGILVLIPICLSVPKTRAYSIKGVGSFPIDVDGTIHFGQNPLGEGYKQSVPPATVSVSPGQGSGGGNYVVTKAPL